MSPDGPELGDERHRGGGIRDERVEGVDRGDPAEVHLAELRSVGDDDRTRRRLQHERLHRRLGQVRVRDAVHRVDAVAADEGEVDVHLVEHRPGERVHERVLLRAQRAARDDHREPRDLVLELERDREPVREDDDVIEVAAGTQGAGDLQGRRADVEEDALPAPHHGRRVLADLPLRFDGCRERLLERRLAVGPFRLEGRRRGNRPAVHATDARPAARARRGRRGR